MITVNGNAGAIINMVLSGELKENDEVFSIINNATYKITKTINHQGEWIKLEEIK